MSDLQEDAGAPAAHQPAGKGRARWAVRTTVTVGAVVGAMATAAPASASPGPAANTVIATIPVFSPTLPYQEPVAAAVDPIRGLAYIVGFDGQVDVISERTNQVIHTINAPDYTSSTGFGLQDITIDPLTQNVFVTDIANNAVYKISEITDKVTATISTPDPHGIGVDPLDGKVFVSNYGEAQVSLISERTNTVIATAPVGTEPQFVVVDPLRGNVFVSNYGGTTVSVINERTLTLTASVSTGAERPFQLAADSANGQVYLTDLGGDTVSVISEASNTITGTISVPGVTDSIAVDPARANVYVGNTTGPVVSVIRAAR
jgi:YVTN family beta-propeller protein